MMTSLLTNATEAVRVQRLLHIILTNLIDNDLSPAIYARLREASRRTNDPDALVALFRTVYLLTRQETLSPELDARITEIHETILHANRVGSYRLIDWSRFAS